MGEESIIDHIKAYVKNRPRLYSILLSFCVPVLATGKSPDWLLENIHPGGRILNLGSGPTNLCDNLINVDIEPYLNVHIAADAHHLPFKENAVAGIINVVMLEHVSDPWAAVREMYRVLKPGGKIYVVTPFVFGFHSVPHDFHRWTIEGVRRLFADFEIIEIGVRSGPTSSLLVVLQEWLAMFFSIGNKTLYQVFYIVFMVLLTPLKVLDFIMCHHPFAHKIAANLYFIGKKCAS